MLLVVFAFIFGYNGFYNAVQTEYSGNYTNLSSSTQTQEIYEKIQSSYDELNSSMTQNPASETNWLTTALNMPSMILNTGITVGYIFLSVPSWFQNLFADLGGSLGFIPTVFITIATFIIMIEIIAWFVYFFTNKKS